MADTTEPRIFVGSREQLLHLLSEASEIEHTLMCSYLYAAFSLRQPDGPDLKPEQAGALTRWRETLMAVAIEEMGHLVLVANLTVAIGGRPHFGRPNFPVSAGYFPSGVVARLSRFSAETIEHFVHLERPRGAADCDADDYAQPDYDRHQPHARLMPSTQDYRTISHLYDAIRLNLTCLSAGSGERQLFLGNAKAQLGPPVVKMAGIAVVETLRDALAAIDTIVDQGEGAPGDRLDSHFRRFQSIQEELATLRASDPDFDPAEPAAENPVLRAPPEPDDKVLIDHPASAALLDIACAAYGQLLRVLGQCFGRGQPEPLEMQGRLFKVALALMHIVNAAGTALTKMPARAKDSDVHAGMTFTMLRGVEPLLWSAETRLLREQLDGLASSAASQESLREHAPTLAKLAAELS